MENIYWLQNNEEIWTRQTALMKISILTVLSKTKGHPKGCPFVLGSAARRAAPPFGISMLGVGKAAPAQFPACGREFTRHSARGPEGPLGGISVNSPPRGPSRIGWSVAESPAAVSPEGAYLNPPTTRFRYRGLRPL